MDFLDWFRSLFGKLTPIPAVKTVTVKPELVTVKDQNAFINQPIPVCGVELIKSFEKCRLEAYQDQGGIWTIGWGHIQGVKEGDTCTQQDADDWLMIYVRDAWKAVLENVTIPLTSCQGGALLSIAYNFGAPKFKKECDSLLVILNSGNYQAIPTKINQLIYFTLPDGGRAISRGLINRRKAEAKLWQGSDWGQT